MGCERAEISACFDITALPELLNWLIEQALNSEDAQLLLRRVIHADGRSRAFINGLPGTVQQLREIGEFLVDIYSQHAHHSLLKQSYQRQILDEYAGLDSLAKEVTDQYRIWHALHQQRLELEQNAAAYADELAELRDQIRELKQLGLTPDEWETLQLEHNRLAHGASLLTGIEECRERLSEGELSALRQLSILQNKLQDLSEYDAELAESLETLSSAVIQLEETDRF